VFLPEYLPRDRFISSNVFRECEVEIGDDNSVIVRSKSLRTGSLSGSTRTSFKYKSQQESEKALSESLHRFYSDLEITNLEVENLNNRKQEVTLIYNYKIPNYISDTGQFKFFKSPGNSSILLALPCLMSSENILIVIGPVWILFVKK